MGRLIDADKLKQHYSWWGGLIGDDYVSELVEQKKVFDTIVDVQPTVDAVPLEDYQSMERTVNKLRMALADAEPVVRCKDCVYAISDSYGMSCTTLCMDTSDDHYCWWGERKEDAETN